MLFGIFTGMLVFQVQIMFVKFCVVFSELFSPMIISVCRNEVRENLQNFSKHMLSSAEILEIELDAVETG